MSRQQPTGAPRLTRFAWLSIGAAVVTIGMKAAAYLLTNSVGLLSDAMESIINLAGGIMALWMLIVAARPADDDHTYGHSKAEYFSSGAEGTLILIAAVSIALAAVGRLFSPRPLEHIGLGLGVSIVASLLNLGVALVLLDKGKRSRSITLESNARHLITDVWTSAGVIVGVGAVAVTGWQQVDPLVALAVAGNICRTGLRIVRRSVHGLMDIALPPEELAIVNGVLQQYRPQGIQYHALRTRQAGALRFVSFHVIVPGSWTVHRGHQLLEQMEAGIRGALENVVVFTHLESLDDPTSWSDVDLDRRDPPH